MNTDIEHSDTYPLEHSQKHTHTLYNNELAGTPDDVTMHMRSCESGHQ
jgi:hypothetical protein